MSSTLDRPRVAFQGQRGAFSEDAAIKLLGAEIELVPRTSFAELFRSLEEGCADYALAPIENSLVGLIRPCLELLDDNVHIVKDEITIMVCQHLIGCPGTLFSEIEIVESHPVALAQCLKFFARHPQLKKVETDDTAGSVARIIGAANHKRAAIAGKRAAELYGGLVIKENVHDHLENYTRFLLLALPSAVDTGEHRRRFRIEPKLRRPH